MTKPDEPRKSEPKGPSDEVDASKGIFPAGVPHPEGAETRMAGELGGGPYEESGRSSLEADVDAARHEATAAALGAEMQSRARAVDEAPSQAEAEARGSLPPHRESSPSHATSP